MMSSRGSELAVELQDEAELGGKLPGFVARRHCRRANSWLNKKKRWQNKIQWIRQNLKAIFVVLSTYPIISGKGADFDFSCVQRVLNDYRGPGFLACVIRPLSHHLPFYLVSNLSLFLVELLMGEWRKGVGEEPNHTPWKSMVLYKSFNSLWSNPSPRQLKGARRDTQKAASYS